MPQCLNGDFFLKFSFETIDMKKKEMIKNVKYLMFRPYLIYLTQIHDRLSIHIFYKLCIKELWFSTKMNKLTIVEFI